MLERGRVAQLPFRLYICGTLIIFLYSIHSKESISNNVLAAFKLSRTDAQNIKKPLFMICIRKHWRQKLDFILPFSLDFTHLSTHSKMVLVQFSAKQKCTHISPEKWLPLRVLVLEPLVSSQEL